MERLKNNPAKYRISPTMLDSYFGYVHSDDIWENYWGYSKEPSITREEFHIKKFDDLIAYINREDREMGEPAWRGIAFNDAIDAMLSNSQLLPLNMALCREEDTLTVVLAEWDASFIFPLKLVDEVCERMAGAVAQQRLEGVIATRYGNVLLTGYSDYIKYFSVIDLKTTSRYELGNFKDNYQHLIYIYILRQQGIDVTEFIYDIIEWYVSKKDRTTTKWDAYEERYPYDEIKTPYKIKQACEQFIRFVIKHSHLITNQRIYNIIDNG